MTTGGRGLALLAAPERIEAALWRRLRFETDGDCRDKLFARHQPLADSIARAEWRRRPRHGAELADFRQWAYAGLLQAIDRYDPLRGVPFQAYARRRIAGNIANNIARMTERDAMFAHQRRAEAERIQSLADGAENDPLRQLTDLVASLAIGLMLQSESPETAYDSLAWREMQSVLGQELARLQPAESDVIRLHYLEGLLFGEVAARMQLSKGRISQLHRAALDRLRKRLASYA